jgi:hypothetical protein
MTPKKHAEPADPSQDETRKVTSMSELVAASIVDPPSGVRRSSPPPPAAPPSSHAPMAEEDHGWSRTRVAIVLALGAFVLVALTAIVTLAVVR